MRSLFTLFALPLAVSAVSLSQFKPFLDDLSSDCDKAYRATVSGCLDADFQDPPCSKACFQGLNEISISIIRNCRNEGITGHNVVVAFLSGSGPSQLCPKVADDNSGKAVSSSSDSPESTTSPASSSSSSPSTSSRSTTSASSTSSSSTSARSSSSSRTTTSLVASTGSPKSISSTASSTTSSELSQSSQTDITHGGSPFDFSGNPSSSAHRVSLRSYVGLVATMLLPSVAFVLL